MKLTKLQQATLDCILFDMQEDFFIEEEETKEPEVDWILAWNPYTD